VIITTNLVFSEWNSIFKNPMTTMAAIDRVVHHSVILDMLAVQSYRAAAANREQLRQPQPAQLVEVGATGP
jgi:DNA replication protein DnaC